MTFDAYSELCKCLAGRGTDLPMRNNGCRISWTVDIRDNHESDIISDISTISAGSKDDRSASFACEWHTRSVVENEVVNEGVREHEHPWGFLKVVLRYRIMKLQYTWKTQKPELYCYASQVQKKSCNSYLLGVFSKSNLFLDSLALNTRWEQRRMSCCKLNNNL